jgi:thiol-disulfide isomerase/thioredoxin
MQPLPKQYRAPEIYGAFWFNSEPIPIHALRGFSILIHFWDYTSSASLRSLPYIQEWSKRYADKELIVIGVHTPEFPFARNPVPVRRAVERLGIKYPVVMDNDYMIWGAFRTRTRPSTYLIDRDGFIRYMHEGEGSYEDLEHSIQALLAGAGFHGDMPLIMEPVRETDRQGALVYRPTVEVYTGYRRGERIGNIEGIVPESSTHFIDPGVYIDGRLYLEGSWFCGKDYCKVDDDAGVGAGASIRYQAKEVNAVIMPDGEKKFQVFVKQGGAFLTENSKGDDVAIDDEGKSFFLVDEPRIYRLIKNQEFSEHTLNLRTRSNGFALYSMSFVSSLIAETMSSN